jgi:hypothetical protein
MNFDYAILNYTLKESHGSIEDNNVIPASRREAGSNARLFVEVVKGSQRGSYQDGSDADALRTAAHRP